MKDAYKMIFVSALLSAIIACIAITGCNTTQQTVAYNSIAALETVATTSVDGYFTLVAKGVVPTNNVPKVAAAYNTFQASAALAATVAQAGTNALASAELQIEFASLTNLVNTAITTTR